MFGGFFICKQKRTINRNAYITTVINFIIYCVDRFEILTKTISSIIVMKMRFEVFFKTELIMFAIRNH